MKVKFNKHDGDNKEEVGISEVPTGHLIMLLIDIILDSKMASQELGMMQAMMVQKPEIRMDMKAQGRVSELKERLEVSTQGVGELADELNTRLSKP